MLEASDGALNDRLGTWVSLSGNVVAVATQYDDNDTGAVYVWRYNGSTWVFDQKLTASDGAPNNWFGRIVITDGNRIVVGANLNSHAFPDAGAAYVYDYNGTSWWNRRS